ncbi:hypothetical protein ON064_17075, partial [Planococcus sp. A6]|nr:hypothetical protein [Planococcus sp. A6]
MTLEFGMQWLNEYFDNIPLQNITPKLYQAMLDDLFKEAKSRSSLTIIHTIGCSIIQSTKNKNITLYLHNKPAYAK